MDTETIKKHTQSQQIMKLWNQFDINEKRTILSEVSEQTMLPDVAIEKDWWVCIILKALFQISCAPYLSFKGGTSLSKAWNIIRRFSEDVDIALNHSFFIEVTDQLAKEPENRTQQKKLRKIARKYVNEIISKELDNQLKSFGITDYFITREIEVDTDKDPTVIYIRYKSVVEAENEYVTPIVKIEISCLSMSYPVEKRRITSYISQYFSDIDELNNCNIQTVLPSRTFLEKIFLLNEEFMKEKPRYLRMSRHLYDLEKLMDTEYGLESIKDGKLYNEIVKHRSLFNHKGYIDYSRHEPQLINIIPPEKQLNKWRDDYQELQVSFIDNKSLTFDNLIDRIKELTTRVKGICLAE